MNFEKANVEKTGFHFISSRVVKPGAFTLWGVNWIQLVQPHHDHLHHQPDHLLRGVEVVDHVILRPEA